MPRDAVVACVDSDPELAGRLASEFGASAATDVGEALGHPCVELVVVATPHHSLAPVASAALEAGKHVLVEKPGAASSAEARELEALAARTGKVVRVGYNHRFHPAPRQARELVHAGAIGDLLWVRAVYGHGGRVGYEHEWRATRALAGGGELLDQGSHVIDLLRWVMGELRLEWAATSNLFWSCDVEDDAMLVLCGGDGVRALVHATWTQWRNTFRLEICGRDGLLRIDGLGDSYGVERLTHYRMTPEMGPPETTIWEYPQADRSWADEMADLEASIAGDAGDGATLADAVACLRVVEDAYDRAAG
jgi:predicted dehydrogenase